MLSCETYYLTKYINQILIKIETIMYNIQNSCLNHLIKNLIKINNNREKDMTNYNDTDRLNLILNRTDVH